MVYYRTSITNTGFEYQLNIYHYKYALGLIPKYEYLKVKERFTNLIDLYIFLTDYFSSESIEYYDRNGDKISDIEFVNKPLYSEVVKN